MTFLMASFQDILNTKSLQDMFKTTFIDKLSQFSVIDTIAALLLAFILGLCIFFVYKKTYKGVMYSASFGVSLVALAMITSLVIMAVTSNVILSLGMVGALSIVRFRTAIKEPLDIVFLFWALAVGIVLGAGLIPLAVLGSIMVGLVLLVFVNRKSNETPYILVLACDGDAAEKSALDLIKANVKQMAVKAKTVTPGAGIELTVEIRINGSATDFVNQIAELQGVRNAVLVSYNGVYTA